MFKKLSLGLSVLMAVLLLPLVSLADRRSFVWTYEYMTMAKGEAEIEYYLTSKLPDRSDRETSSWQQQFELEYGITNRWDISLYQVFNQKNTATSSTLEYAGFKVRTRYRLGKKGEYLLNPLLYFEVIREDDLSNPVRLEAKLILAKDIDRFTIAYNQIAEQEFENGEKEIENKYAFGITYEIDPKFKLGLESTGNYSENKYYLGPTLSLAREKFWLSFGILGGLNGDSDDTQSRLLIGIPF